MSYGSRAGCLRQTHSLLSRLYQTCVSVIQLLTQQQWRVPVPVACGDQKCFRAKNAMRLPTLAMLTSCLLTNITLNPTLLLRLYVTIAVLSNDLDNM